MVIQRSSLGYIRIASASPKMNVADVDYNISEILNVIEENVADNIDVIVFPELSITGNTCGDLYFQRPLLEGVKNGVRTLLNHSGKSEFQNLLVIVGAPVEVGNSLYDAAIAICNGKIVAIVPKSNLCNHNEFNHQRWFKSGYGELCREIDYCGQKALFGSNIIISHAGSKLSIEVGDDLIATIPPSSYSAVGGAEVIINPAAVDDIIGKRDYILSLIKSQSARCQSAYVHTSVGYGESSTDLVFTGDVIIAENGKILSLDRRETSSSCVVISDIDLEILRNERVVTGFFRQGNAVGDYIILDTQCHKNVECNSLKREINPMPFVPSDIDELYRRCQDIIDIQTCGLMRRLQAAHANSIVVGISGGLDSTLALLIAVEAFKRLEFDLKNIIGITMPGFGTTDRTYTNALTLMDRLGITRIEIPIADSVRQHFKDIDHDESVKNVTYENSQARERTQILMDYANKVNGLVLGTGDLSELALGWCTYNGDHMSMYAVNASVPKTLVRSVVSCMANDLSDNMLKEALLDIVDTPISPELIPAKATGEILQKTEDLVGPYELHDFFIFNLMRYSYTPNKIFVLAQLAFEGKYTNQEIKHWLATFCRRFFTQQFKRSCMPDGPKIGSVGLSPRGDWQMPSDASFALWIKNCEAIKF